MKSAAGRENRAKLATFLESVDPDGGTNTYAALRRAYDFQGIDTIILFTDGAPNDGNVSTFDPKEAEKIYSLCRQHNTIPINTVGLGNYFKQDLADFLQRVAELTNGTFLGR